MSVCLLSSSLSASTGLFGFGFDAFFVYAKSGSFGRLGDNGNDAFGFFAVQGFRASCFLGGGFVFFAVLFWSTGSFACFVVK